MIETRIMNNGSAVTVELVEVRTWNRIQRREVVNSFWYLRTMDSADLVCPCGFSSLDAAIETLENNTERFLPIIEEEIENVPEIAVPTISIISQSSRTTVKRCPRCGQTSNDVNFTTLGTVCDDCA